MEREGAEGRDFWRSRKTPACWALEDVEEGEGTSEPESRRGRLCLQLTKLCSWDTGRDQGGRFGEGNRAVPSGMVEEAGAWGGSQVSIGSHSNS